MYIGILRILQIRKSFYGEARRGLQNLKKKKRWCTEEQRFEVQFCTISTIVYPTKASFVNDAATGVDCDGVSGKLKISINNG